MRGFFPDAAERSYVEERLKRYEMRTLSFIAREFPEIAARLDVDELRELVQSTYKRAKARGLKSEVDHWKYLIVVFFWGSHFEKDPQHAPALARAGWLDVQGKETQNVNLGPVLREVDLWVILSARDMGRLDGGAEDILRVCVEGVDRFETIEQAHQLVMRLWPLKYAGLGEAERDWFFRHLFSIMEADRVPPQMRALYVALSFQFGHGFHRDPLYRTLGDYFAQAYAGHPRTILGPFEKIAVPYASNGVAS